MRYSCKQAIQCFRQCCRQVFNTLLTKCILSLLNAGRETHLKEEDCKKKVEGLRAAAKKAKSMYSKLKAARGVKRIEKLGILFECIAHVTFVSYPRNVCVRCFFPRTVCKPKTSILTTYSFTAAMPRTTMPPQQ